MSVRKSAATPRPGTTVQDATGLLGLREIAVALDGWLVDPGEAGRARLVEAFGRAVEGSGLAGGHLHLHAPPIAEVELEWGSLAGGGAAGNLRTYDLRFGDRTLAHLDLDVPPDSRLPAVFSVDEFARGLEIVVGSAWSQARASRVLGRVGAPWTSPLAASPACWTWTASCS